MRVFVIWITGIVALGTFGSLVGFALANNRNIGEYTGTVAGICLFICLRLWFAKPSANSN
jgi:hypothetical protein